MSRFEILCVTMNQNDFSKIKSMNIHSDVVFANQCERTEYEEFEFDGHNAKMISTQTRGVGINRNLTLMYASAEICLLADDDVEYRDDVEQIVLKEFDSHPDADVFIFNLNSIGGRKIRKSFKTQKCSRLFRKTGGGVRIAFRLASIRKANLWFTTLFGGGCIFPCGEDSMWMVDAYNKKLTVYVSKETIGVVSFDSSSWFDGFNEKYFYGFGAYYKNAHPVSYPLWVLYLAIRTAKMTKMSFFSKIHWMINGISGFDDMISYQKFVKKI